MKLNRAEATLLIDALILLNMEDLGPEDEDSIGRMVKRLNRVIDRT